MHCPACNAPNPPENQRCQHCGEKLPFSPSHPAAEDEVEVAPALPASAEDADERQPRPDPPEQIDDEETKQRRRARRRSQEEDEGPDVILTFIPYKNPRALAAYYCGFFALIPGLGFVLGVVAILLGILGLQYASANPNAKGAAHAITGIVLGVVAFFCWNPVVCFLLYMTYWYPW